MKKFLIPSLITLFLFSCSKEITIDLPAPDKKIVVDGGIFVGKPAEINLTWSTGYFEPVDSASLANYLISNATVYVKDGNMTDTLHIGYDPNRVIPIVWIGSTILGQVGHTYELTVIAEGRTATSTTTIRNPVLLDSAWFQVEGTLDSLGYAWAHLSDPPGQNNGYRWYAKRLNKDADFLVPYGAATDDKFYDGTSFDFAYNRPVLNGSTATDDNNIERYYYKRGDTIVIQFCSIGQAEVNFFRTYESVVSSNGNPFAAPGTIKTNVTGGLGIFCGYSPSFDTIICH
ncbi:hypothetical protein BH09BAC5_BH09BAC5_15530 [soil metagenome]